LTRVPPTVSVVVPTYNRADLLREAIDSVLLQTFGDFELLVVDDGSTDHTRDVVAAVEDRRCRYLARAHRGIGAALNAGLQAARGRYFARLDSDDVWLPEMLETLVNVMDAAPELGFAYGRGRVILADGTPLDHLQGTTPRYPDHPWRSIVYDDCTCNVALLARSECLGEVGGFDEELIAHEDWDMWLRVTARHPFRFVDRELVLIRRHGGNLTALRSELVEDVLSTRTAPLDKLYSSGDLPPDIRALQPLAYTNVHLYVAQRWMHAGDWRRTLATLARALSTGANPVATAARFAWLGRIAPILARTSAGRRLVEGLAGARRRLRPP
jgi:glycosyltransferase involved in cell wall biosynthesis